MEFIEKIYNNYNLKKNQIDEITTRARGLIINSNDQILMCYSNGLSHFEFPGGHLEKNETLLDCLYREILEETGLEIKNEEIIPFYSIKYYCKNYKNSGKNRLVKIFYYIIYSNLVYNSNKRKLVGDEIKENYECIYVPILSLKQILLNNMKTTKEDNSALSDMLLVWNEYLKIKKKME